MKRFIFLPLCIAMLLTACDSDSSTLWDELPESIAEFVAQYYPNNGVSGYATNDENQHTVYLHNSATLRFDADYRWIEIDGNGITLPQVLVFDQLPPELYKYLQETDNTTSVYAAMRNSTTYTLRLSDTTLYYDIDSGSIRRQ